MQSMRATWTDERLDDLIQHMDDGFYRVDKELREQRHEMREGFASVSSETQGEFASVRSETQGEFASVRSEMGKGFAAVGSEFAAARAEAQRGLESVRGDSNQQFVLLREEMQTMGSEINARFDSLHRVMIQFGGSLIVAFVGLIVAVVLRGG